MRVIISGGGTGGHIYPALTIANTLCNLDKDTEILFVGTKHGLESDIVPKEGYQLKTIEVYGFERKISLQNFKNLFVTLNSLLQAKKVIAEFKPDVVIGTGGYVCGPVLLVASLMGIPTVIQEQNVIPGITNKILSRFVKKIAVGYEEAARYFPHKEKVVVTGNPIRADVMTAQRKEGYAEFDLDENKYTILVSGGSRGARSINQAMVEVYKLFAGRQDIQILHVTGQSEYNNIVSRVKQDSIDPSNYGNIIIKPYVYNMPQALAIADIAVFRAGAIGLAELTARGIPAVLIPYPYAAENHQEFNARVLEANGAAVVIRDKELTGQKLSDSLVKILEDEKTLLNMAGASKKLGRPNAAEKIALLVLELVK